MYRLLGPSLLVALISAGCAGGSGGAGAMTAAGGESAAAGGGDSTAAGTGGQSMTSEGGGAGMGALPSSTTCDVPWPAAAPTLQPSVWTPINPTGPVFAGDPGSGSFVQGMAIDPCNSSTLYVTVQNFDPSKGGGLYKSIDAGAHWTRIGELDEPIRVRVDPKNPLHLYAGDGVRGSTLGFYVSQDGGNTWTKPAGFSALLGKVYNIDDIYDVAADPADFQHVLLTFHSEWGAGGAGKDSGVLESKDGGDTWIAHPPMSGWGAGLNVWFLGSSTTWLLGSQSAGYWRTADSGATWKQVSMEPMTHGGGQLYASGNTFYTSCNGGVQRSVDNGLTWMTIQGIQPTTAVYGDGTTLYTHPAYGFGAQPFMCSPESDGTTWSPCNGGTQMFTDGPFEMAFDAKQRILYSANWGNGLLAMKVP